MENYFFKIVLGKSLMKRYRVQRCLAMNTCMGATETLVIIFKMSYHLH